MPSRPPSEKSANHIFSHGQRYSADDNALTPASRATKDAAGGLGQLVHRDEILNDEIPPTKQLDSATVESYESTWAPEEFAEVIMLQANFAKSSPRP